MKWERDQGRRPQNAQQRGEGSILPSHKVAHSLTGEPLASGVSGFTDAGVGLTGTGKSDLLRGLVAKIGNGKGDKEKGQDVRTPGVKASDQESGKAAADVSGGSDRGKGGNGLPTINGEFGRDNGDEDGEPRTDRTPMQRERAPKKWEPLANHPVDISLGTLKGAIEYAVGQPVTLGMPYGRKNYFDEDVTGAVLGSPRFLAYGAEGSTDVWTFSFWDKKLEKMDISPSHVTTHDYLKNRAEYTGVDERLFSRTIFADAEIKPVGKFTQDAITSLVNIKPEEIASSGIDLGDVSHSQARRIIDVMRNQYASGNWRETLQLAIATSHIGNFTRMARERSWDDLDDSVVTVADKHIGEELTAEYRTDVDLLVARSLKRGIQEMREEGRTEAATHAEAWLSMHEENMTLDSFPPEVTLEDILQYPSYLNPRPDKGVPVMASVGYLVGGTGSRNLTIKYPDGSIYAVDYPTHGYGARPIRGHEEDGYRGNINDGTVKGFVQVNEEWLDFAEDVKRHVAGELVDEAIKKDSSFKRDRKEYADTLRAASTFVDEQQLDMGSEQIVAVKEQLATVLMAARCIDQSDQTVGAASSMFEYSVRGWGSKSDVEEETGISLTPFHSSLSEDLKQAYTDFGNALYGLELARLAEAYAQHPEFSTHIAQRRTYLKLDEGGDHYHQQMMEAVNRLMQGDKVSELAKTLFATTAKSSLGDAVLSQKSIPGEVYSKDRQPDELTQTHDERQPEPEAPVAPEVRGFISQMEEAMHRPEYNTAVVPMQLAVELWRMDKISSLAEFEKGLREMDSRVHFIAMPREALKEKWAFIPVNDWDEVVPEAEQPAQTSSYQVIYPSEVKNEGEPGYWLWVAVNGSEEAAKMRERLGVTEEENAHRLKTTGVLALPSENNE